MSNNRKVERQCALCESHVKVPKGTVACPKCGALGFLDLLYERSPRPRSLSQGERDLGESFQDLREIYMNEI